MGTWFSTVNWEERRTAAAMLSQQRNRGKAIAVKSGLLLGNSLERSFWKLLWFWKGCGSLKMTPKPAAPHWNPKKASYHPRSPPRNRSNAMTSSHLPASCLFSKRQELEPGTFRSTEPWGGGSVPMSAIVVAGLKSHAAIWSVKSSDHQVKKSSCDHSKETCRHWLNWSTCMIVIERYTYVPWFPCAKEKGN